VCFGATEWARIPANFGGDIRALAQMGFAVLEVNHRGVAGLGHKNWQAGRENIAAVAVEDALLAVDRIAKQADLDGRQIAFFGRSFGGLLALRAATLQPARTACVIAIDPRLELVEWKHWSPAFSNNAPLREAARDWFFGKTTKERRVQSPLHQAEGLRRPILLAAREKLGFDPDPDLASFRRRLKREGNETVFSALSDDLDAPRRYDETFAAIEQFLAKHLAHTGENNP
jgi:dipeptidyl aminopeptidase/acylaminoacyl peptidase